MASEKLQLFAQHSRSWRENRYVYPVVSRRSRGLSIGVNLNPDKACNFDCIYCCVNRRAPAANKEVDLGVLSAELDHMLRLAGGGGIYREAPFDQTPEALRRINDVAFSGDGEPTVFEGFGEACGLVVELLKKHRMSGLKIVVITNGTLLHRPAIAEAMEYLDRHNGEIWAKLDAGTEEYYRLVMRTSIPMGQVLENIAQAGRVRPIVIQSLFVKVGSEPPSRKEILAYAERLRELVSMGCRIKLVQVYTVARPTAEAYAAPLGDAALEAIAEEVKAVGLAVETYYGTS